MNGPFYDSPAGKLASAGGAHIARAKLQEAVTAGVSSYASAKLYGWTSGAMGEKSLPIRIYPHSGTTFSEGVESGAVVWVIRRPDAKASDGTWGRWEILSGPAGGGEMPTIPFRNDSGETAPAYAVMQIIDVETDSRTATVDTSSDIWTLSSTSTWSNGQRLRYTTTGSAPTTSPAGELTDGATVWARMLTTSTLKLYPSEADAIADTNAINYTTAGSGTHTLSDVDASEFLTIKKPKLVSDRFEPKEYSRLYVVNEGEDVADGETGKCRMFSCSYGFPVRVLVDTADFASGEPPATGDVLGPVHDSWKLGKRRCGFVVLGNYDKEAETVTVIHERERLSGHDFSQFTAANHSNGEDLGGRDIEPYEAGFVEFGGATAFGMYPPPHLYTSQFANITGIASADGIASDSTGQISLCYDRPAWALYDEDQGTPRVGDIYGVFPGQDDGKLRRGLPGFCCLNYDTSKKIMLVIADHRCTVFDAKAKANWVDVSTQSPTVQAHPYDAYAGKSYDGSEAGWPDITLTISLPRNGSGRDPNIRTGNRLQYSVVASYGMDESTDIYRYLCVSPYLDDKIGTVKMFTGDISDVPQGWREHTGMRDRFPVGVLASTGIATSVGNTGGTKTHVHTGAAGIGSAGTSNSMNQASHVPPFYGVYFIERFQ